MRAAIYSRFSSENQSASSLADQIEVCSRYITKSGWTAVTTYSDAAMSGASRFRPGYQQLLADLDCGVFDVVVVEALDRLGRKLADIADLYDRCTFAGIILVAVNVGEITAMHIGMPGTMAQLYLSDLKQKTWRGQLGRALQGKIPGGKAYGYDLVTAATGERHINPVEAAIVREFNAEMRKLATSAECGTSAAKRALADIKRKLAAIVRAIEDGAYTPTLKARLTVLEQEKAHTEARLRAGKHAPVLQLHTNLPELYRNKIGRLAEALSAPETVAEAAEVMRGLIDRIVLTPAAGELRAELHGDLAVLARFAQEGEGKSGENQRRLSVVAGVRFRV